MKETPRLVVFVLATAIIPACGSSTEKTQCPYVVVNLDSGTDAFANVGDYASDGRCARFCDKDHPVCQLLSSTEVKCQKGCE